jgi:Flp pilus assembly protein TadD
MDEAYDAFQEGTRLLESSNVHAAVVALERARRLEPDKGSIREALARAYFRSGDVGAARREFEKSIELDPVNDYAHFGLGLCLLRAGDREAARGHLKLATVMRPEVGEYRDALDRSLRAAR